MNLYDRLHFLVRAWRYRLRGEEFGIAFLRSRKLENKTAVDIGANRGIYSYWMQRQVGPRGRVIAFEPQPELGEYLHDLRRSFGLNSLEIANCGLSSHPGELFLRRPKGHWGGASFDRHLNRQDGFDIIKTSVTTLDAFFDNHSARPVSFIKCDVEGHELQVFRGGAKILREDRPELLFECSDPKVPETQVFTYLQTLGYEGYCFHRDGFAPVSEYRSLSSQMHKRALRDFVFVPQEKAHGLLRRCA